MLRWGAAAAARGDEGAPIAPACYQICIQASQARRQVLGGRLQTSSGDMAAPEGEMAALALDGRQKSAEELVRDAVDAGLAAAEPCAAA